MNFEVRVVSIPNFRENRTVFTRSWEGKQLLTKLATSLSNFNDYTAVWL
jgi:hypothetical protein